jgi:fatty-acid peroxygenase
MANILSENAFSAVFGLLREGFGFIGKRRKKYQSDIFQIAVPGLKVICFGGEDAARNFYDPEYFMRKGAVPPPVQKTLTGENAIHTTDGAIHHNRKAMFMALMTPEDIKRLTDLIGTELDRSAKEWENQDWVVLFNEAQQFLCKAVCTWAGVPLKDNEVQSKAADFVSIVDAFGAVGPRNWNGRAARGRIEQWLMGIIADVRGNRLIAEPGTALFAAATHRDTFGNLFDLHMAAVELMNIIRPTIAISWYIVFGAKALHDYPAFRQDFLRNEGGKYRDWFIDEIRRFYPFAPFMGARVKKTFAWHGYVWHEPRRTFVGPSRCFRTGTF